MTTALCSCIVLPYSRNRQQIDSGPQRRADRSAKSSLYWETLVDRPHCIYFHCFNPKYESNLLPDKTAGFDDAQLQQIKTLYDNETIALAQICEQFDLTYYQLGKLIKAQNWQKRPTKTAKKRSLIKRMKAIAAHHIRALEKSQNTDEQTTSAANRDKDTRTLRTLLKIIEDLNALTKATDETQNNDEEIAINASQRIEIAKRLEALRGNN